MSKTILIAATHLQGGSKDGPFALPRGEHLTAEAQKKLGLSKTDVEELHARGVLIEARTLVAEGSREVATLEARVGELETDLAAAVKRAEAAEARVAELDRPAK